MEKDQKSLGEYGFTFFDGGNRSNLENYIARCKGGVINLHRFYLGHYRGCVACNYRENCLSESDAFGEH